MYKRYKWMKRYLRFRLAIQQLRLKPYLNMLLGIVLIGFVVFWKNKEIFYIHVPQFLLPICRGTVHFMGISLFVFLLFFTVYMIGVFTASRDEMNLEIAFNGNDLRNGCPILIQKKMDKETGVTKREFYSNIPMQRWVKNKEEIADSMKQKTFCVGGTAAEWKKRMLKKSIVSNIMKICILSKIMEELVWRNIFSVTEPGLRLIRS